LVRMLMDGRKTATVTILTPGIQARIAFTEGTAVHAVAGELSGEEAFKRIYLWKSGDFVIEHGVATAERTIKRRMDLLLAEAMEEQTQSEAALLPPAEKALTIDDGSGT